MLVLSSFTPLPAQNPKLLKTKSGVSVILVNLVNARPDCSAKPGPTAVPVLREKPASGTVRLLVVAADIPASRKCAARKVPATALVYTPNKDFEGTDFV